MHRNHLAMCLLLGLGGILLAAAAGIPFSSLLPLLLVGGCLLMHLVMPHGEHHTRPSDDTSDTAAAGRRGEER